MGYNVYVFTYSVYVDAHTTDRMYAQRGEENVRVYRDRHDVRVSYRFYIDRKIRKCAYSITLRRLQTNKQIFAAATIDQPPVAAHDVLVLSIIVCSISFGLRTMMMMMAQMTPCVCHLSVRTLYNL